MSVEITIPLSLQAYIIQRYTATGKLIGDKQIVDKFFFFTYGIVAEKKGSCSVTKCTRCKKRLKRSRHNIWLRNWVQTCEKNNIPTKLSSETFRAKKESSQYLTKKFGNKSVKNWVQTCEKNKIPTNRVQ